jgi:KDO2-lipid IV(A) lauroyltransferase
MELILYVVARAVVSLIQALPLRWAARLGRFGGWVAWCFDARHRRVALHNLSLCLGSEKSRAELRALARENFRRIGENFACAAKTASMTFEQLKPHVEFVGDAQILAHESRVSEPSGQAPGSDPAPQSIVAAIGHFGNFELYARFGQFAPAYRCATTYRALRQPMLNRLLQNLRERSGCAFFERRFDAPLLRAFMNQPGVMLGLLSDQRSGKRGLRLPFLGHDCYTSPAPAVFALRYRCALYVGVCFRTGLARWRIEGGPQIPTHENGAPRSTGAIMADVNAAFETAVRRDPANWFWVHNRWKMEPKDNRTSGPQDPRTTGPEIADATSGHTEFTVESITQRSENRGQTTEERA